MTCSARRSDSGTPAQRVGLDIGQDYVGLMAVGPGLVTPVPKL